MLVVRSFWTSQASFYYPCRTIDMEIFPNGDWLRYTRDSIGEKIIIIITIIMIIIRLYRDTGHAFVSELNLR